ncbi:protein YPR117W [Monosporozyma servazzii]
MLFEYISAKLFYLFKITVILLIGFFVIQSLISFTLSALVRFTKIPLDNFSFGYILGLSIRKINLSSKAFSLSIGRISLSFSWNPTIIFHDVDITLLQNNTRHSKIKQSKTTHSFGTFNTEKDALTFQVTDRQLKIFRMISAVGALFRRVNIRLQDDTLININMISLAVIDKVDKQIGAEIFLYNIKIPKNNEKIHHAGLNIKCDVQRGVRQLHKETDITLLKWSCSFKLGETTLFVPLDASLGKPNDIKKDITKMKKEELISIGEETVHSKVTKFVKPFKHVFRTLDFIDIKIEILTLSYAHAFSLNISSIQLSLKTIDILNNGVSRSILPSAYFPWGEYEISAATNALVLKVDNISILRVPLINLIITSNLLLYFAEDLPLSKTIISCNANIINPSFFATLDQIIHLMETYDSLLKSFSSPTQTKIKSKSNDHRVIKLIETFWSLESHPTFSIDLAISNFNSILQLSRHKNLVFKIFNIQALLARTNKLNMAKIDKLSITASDKSSSVSTQSFKKSSNFVKIVGVEFLYMETSHDDTLISIPIIGFERMDTFVHGLDNKKLSVESTLRHFYSSLDNLNVLDILSKTVSQIHKTLPKSKSHTDIATTKSTNESTLMEFLRSFQWDFKFRFKDISISMVLANYLPTLLDPLEIDGFNLSEVQRGIKIICHEAQLKIDKNGKHISVIDTFLDRIMDNEEHRSVSDTLIHFSNFDIDIDNNSNLFFILPVILIKFDVNALWLVFYMINIVHNHLPQKKPTAKSISKPGTQNILEKVNVDITKIVLDISLPSDIPLLFVLKNINYIGAKTTLSIGFFATLVESVYTKDRMVYVTLLEIENILINIREVLENKSVVINSETISLHTEYHFKVYLITDNVVTFYKSFKQLRSAFADISEYKRVYPAQQMPVALPDIQLLSDKFLIDIEEDPFEQELGLIFKVGVLEQRERIHMLNELDKQMKAFNSRDSTPEGSVLYSIDERVNVSGNPKFEEIAYNKVMEHFSTSWITRYKKAKYVFQGMPAKIRFNEELGINYTIFSREETSTVANLVIENMHLKFNGPSFQLDSYSDFLYEYGKGIPRDTMYTLLIIMGINFKTDLWELRLRDYPLPVLSFPNTSTKGDVVFCEQMPDDMAYHTVYVPFVKSTHSGKYTEINSIYGSHIIRTMNSVKSFANCTTSINSSEPVNITWGKSLQPGIESLMIWFDYLTKPKLDPSPKLGFWDKFRYLFHGKWLYHFAGNTGLHLNIKGAHNPYTIADDGAGLTFCWNGDTTLDIHGTADPKELIKIESQNFQLGIRDFTVTNKFDKILMRLNGNVVWKMGMLFEKGCIKQAGETPRQIPTRSHHNIHLVNPDLVTDIKDYDSYTNFRSGFIHMSFGVYSYQAGSSNSIYLAPQAVSHFLKWWNLFNTYTSGPIRQGPLFTDLLQNKTKFGRSLFTIKYQLHVEPLNVVSVYQHILTQNVAQKGVRKEFTGIKGRFNSLKIDLHQRKLKLTHTNAKLNKTQPVWKFRMSSGEMDCAEPDVRVLSTIFDKSIYERVVTPTSNSKQQGFNEQKGIDLEALSESEWYDYDDYKDLNQLSFSNSFPVKLEAIPLLYSPRISYFRKLNEQGMEVDYPFGEEDSHDCIIGQNHPEKTQEGLIQKRKIEIEAEIKEVEFKIDNMAYSNHAIKKVDQKVLDGLHKRLHELKKSLHIVRNILNDLKVSSGIPDTFEGHYTDDEEEIDSLASSLNNDGISPLDVGSLSTNVSLLRASTVESFVSMRKASTIRSQSSYDNRFIVHNIQLILDKRLRDHLIEYASNMFERRVIRYAMTFKSVKIFKELLSGVLRQTKSLAKVQSSTSEDDNFSTNAEFIEQFEELIKAVPDDNFEAIDSYLFRLISPQIQISSEQQPTTAVILSARDIEVGIIDVLRVTDNDGKRIAMDFDTIVETRYCTIAKDVQLFTLFKEEVASQLGSSFHKKGYGMEKWSGFWPPWIPLEMCFDGSLLENHMVLKRRSMFLTFTVPNPLFLNNHDLSGFSNDSICRIGFPGLVLKSTSRQYNSFYSIIQDLLSFNLNTEEKVKRLTKTLLADEIRNNLDKLDLSVITDSQDKVRNLFYTRSFLKVNNPKLYSKHSQDMLEEIGTSLLQLTVLMKAIKQNHDRLGNSNDGSRELKWQIETDELIWELYDDKNLPFVTIGLGPSTYTRTETSQGLVTNRVAISSLHCFNLQNNAIFVELLAPFKENSLYQNDEPMVGISWVQIPPVGGISNLEELIVTLQPLIFKMDRTTGNTLMNYLFPKISHDSEKEKKKVVTSGTSPSIDTTHMYSPRTSFSSSIHKDDSDNSSIQESKEVDSWDLGSHILDSTSTKTGRQRFSTQRSEVANTLLKQNQRFFNEMLLRAGLYYNIQSIVIKKTVVQVSYKGSRKLLTDVNNLTVNVPELSYHDKLWSRDEFFAVLKHDVVKIVVHHLGSIIGNKLIPHKKENKSKIKIDMSQIGDYTSKESKSRSISLLNHPKSDSNRTVSSKKTESFKGFKETSLDYEDDDVKPFYPA